jgi:hypothetical protein
VGVFQFALCRSQTMNMVSLSSGSNGVPMSAWRKQAGRPLAEETSRSVHSLAKHLLLKACGSAR